MIVGADHGAAILLLDADVPPLSRGQGVKAPIRNERRHLQVDGARAPQQAVGHEGRVDTIRHPDPALDRGIGDGERPYRQRSFQAKRFEIAIAIRGDLAVAELGCREWVAHAIVDDPIDRIGDENGARDRRLQGGDQQAMVRAGRYARDCRRGIATQPVRYQPLAPQSGAEIASDLATKRNVRSFQDGTLVTLRHGCRRKDIDSYRTHLWLLLVGRVNTPFASTERTARRRQRYSAGVALYKCPGHLLRQSIGRGAVDEVGDDGGPAGLMTGADAGAVVAVEVLVKEDLVAPVRVGLHTSVAPKTGRRPSGPRRKIEIRRREISSAISSRGRCWPEPVGYSTMKSSP